MHLYLVDEVNPEYAEGKFFLLGGLVLSADQIPQVDAAVKARRDAAGYENGDSFKFHTRSYPKHVGQENFRVAKAGLLEDLAEIGVRFIATAVLHDIAVNDHSKLMSWGLPNIGEAYRRLLIQDDAQGLMLMDRDTKQFDLMADFHQHGFKYPSGGTTQVQDRIVLFGMTNNNASHLSSATDIAMGAFSFCVEAALGNAKEEIAIEMFRSFRRMVWMDVPEIGRPKAIGYGYLPSPRPDRVLSTAYKAQYTKLSDGLGRFSKAAKEVE
ncbi:hypothetical protein [Microbacterium sp. 2RAF4]|uniref:hypothetical protein n=1 Tax=Microbacterium sp. 2RAF4 TaxID=3232999 RepID=UPI003F969B93